MFSFVCSNLFLLLISLKFSAAIMCEYGQAIKDPNNPTQDLKCDANTPCPGAGKFQCTNVNTFSVCCPTAAAICSQAKMEGAPCDSTAGGTRFYFDSSRGSCVSFNFLGCFGNDNNFATFDDCAKTCISKICPRGYPALIAATIQFCGPSLAPCQPGYKCTSTTAYPSITSACCLSPLAICSKASDPGIVCPTNPSAPTQTFFFNQVTQACETLTYNGCGGNENNFKTQVDCQQYCNGQTNGILCPSGTKPASGTNIQTPCTADTNQCAKNFTCLKSASDQSTWNYCCTSPPVSFFCPSSGTPYFDPSDNTKPVTCASVGRANCPDKYSCTSAKSGSQGFCCKNHATQIDQSFWLNCCTLLFTLIMTLFVKLW